MHSTATIRSAGYASVGLASIVTGLVRAPRPQAGLAIVLALVVAAVGARLARVDATVIAVGLMLAFSASADIFGHISVGPTSAYSWVTLGILLLLTLLLASQPKVALDRDAVKAVQIVALFPLYALFSTVWHPVSLASIQNTLVYVDFFVVYLFAACAFSVHTFDKASSQRAVPDVRWGSNALQP